MNNDQKSITAHTHPQPSPALAMSAVCYAHPERASDYICRACSTTYCQTCTKFINKIAVCQLCDEVCSPYAEMRRATLRWLHQQIDFGWPDFARALACPLTNPAMFFVIAILYSLLIFGGDYCHD